MGRGISSKNKREHGLRHYGNSRHYSAFFNLCRSPPAELGDEVLGPCPNNSRQPGDRADASGTGGNGPACAHASRGSPAPRNAQGEYVPLADQRTTGQDRRKRRSMPFPRPITFLQMDPLHQMDKAHVDEVLRHRVRIDSEAVLVYAFNVYRKEKAMPRAAVDDNNRVALRVRPADKAVIMRAAALAQTDMTTFILRTVLREAQAVIEEHERVKLTQRDSRLVMELLENPPAPNAKLRKAAGALPEGT
jgi:uncharacterized protein (DUF1778 family)